MAMCAVAVSRWPEYVHALKNCRALDLSLLYCSDLWRTVMSQLVPRPENHGLEHRYVRKAARIAGMPDVARTYTVAGPVPSSAPGRFLASGRTAVRFRLHWEQGRRSVDHCRDSRSATCAPSGPAANQDGSDGTVGARRSPREVRHGINQCTSSAAPGRRAARSREATRAEGRRGVDRSALEACAPSAGRHPP
jgi:hypothetical protein